MKNFSAVVYTAGRTGSHIIIQNLCRHYNIISHAYTDRGFIDGVVHSHNPLYESPTDNFIAIISHRRNLFEAIVSMKLTKKTNEFIQYTNKEISPYAIDITKFKNCYFYQKAFYQSIDRTKYKKIVDIDYEDLISDSNCLLADFGIVIDLSLIDKSPYDYHNLITNIDELQEIFQELEQVPITLEELKQFKKTVEEDLMNILENHNGNRL